MAIISRVSTFVLNQTTISNFNKVYSDIATLQKQISSGYKADTFSQMSNQVEQFSNLTGEIGKLKNYEATLTLTTSRFESVGTALTRIIEVVDNMENIMTLRRNGAIEDNIEFAVQMDGFKKSLGQELNTTFGGRYLFSGTKTNEAPIADPIPDPITPGVPDDNYYQGSKENVIFRPQDNFELEFDVRADNAGFQKVFSAVAQSVIGDATDDDGEIVDALNLLQDGLREIIALKTKNDAKVVNLKDITERHETYRLYLQGVSDEIIKTDVVSASTQVAVDQTILSATFQSYARITSLRLVDYL